MKFYRQIAINSAMRDVDWTVSQAAASAKRSEWTKKGYKRAEIITEEVDVPTDKNGLLAFLNERKV